MPPVMITILLLLLIIIIIISFLIVRVAIMSSTITSIITLCFSSYNRITFSRSHREWTYNPPPPPLPPLHRGAPVRRKGHTQQPKKLEFIIKHCITIIIISSFSMEHGLCNHQYQRTGEGEGTSPRRLMTVLPSTTVIIARFSWLQILQMMHLGFHHHHHQKHYQNKRLLLRSWNVLCLLMLMRRTNEKNTLLSFALTLFYSSSLFVIYILSIYVSFCDLE